MGPLSFMRVVDLTDLRGAMCGRMLADLGADVVLVEPASADPAARTTTAHRYRHANKRGHALTGRVEEARPIARRGLELEPGWRVRMLSEIGLVPAIANKLAAGARLLGLPE